MSLSHTVRTPFSCYWFCFGRYQQRRHFALAQPVLFYVHPFFSLLIHLSTFLPQYLILNLPLPGIFSGGKEAGNIIFYLHFVLAS